MRIRAWGAAAKALLLNPRQELPVMPSWILSWRFMNPIEGEFPWISIQARRRLEKFLQTLDGRASVFEYGSGGSTFWLAKQSASVVSIEHDAAWYREIAAVLEAKRTTNVNLRLIEAESGPASNLDGISGVSYGSDTGGNFERYVTSINEFPDSSIDLVIVDGRSRAACMVEAASKVRSGGLIYLDDADRQRYGPGVDALKGWKMTRVGGLRPRDSPNKGLLLEKP